MKIKDIIKAIEAVAPRNYQESYDNAGIQVGNPDSETNSAIICIDITEEVIDEAIAKNINLIISHHPLIFKGIKSLTGKTYIERCVIKSIQSNICLYAAHTNLDNARFGVNDFIAKKLGLSNISVLDPKPKMLAKLVTFVPFDYADKVREALFNAGAGGIGNYDSCSYNSEGFGTFKAGEECNPFCGKVGEIHKEKEIRIEVIMPLSIKNSIVSALLKSHPYEEPAFDIIALENSWDACGSGILGELESPIDELSFLKDVKTVLGNVALRYSTPRENKISKVAVCGGAGSFLIPNAISAGADAFITGEIKYHDYFGNQDDILLVEAGHYESEHLTMQLLKNILNNKYPTFETYITEVNTNPINYL
ncbi:MAG: Nif3-like dinuclear metal center hexameric protein [Bacteroidales bacterium]|nr:Nif3-like dinuclear metal center hexameric protein [Bacteroidales bacterium]